MIMEMKSPLSDAKDDDLGRDRRRISLLNDPNYGVILCFLDKFRATLDLPHYPLQLFEDHLVNSTEQNPSRLIDFHFFLLRRLSLAKNAQRDKFDSVISKFASRFAPTDNEQLSSIGYSQSDLSQKVRTIKNLLESQLDLTQTLKNTLVEQPAYERRSTPLGRDRFGASYWFFVDDHCFVRLFREDADTDRTWSNIAKDRNELQEFTRLLVADSIVRQRFPDWTIDYPSFAAVLPTNVFEQGYSSIRETNQDDEIENSNTLTEEKSGQQRRATMKRKRGRTKRWTKPRAKKIASESTKENGFPSMEDDPPDVSIEMKSWANSNSSMEEEEEAKSPARQERKYRTIVDESQHDENSLDDMSLALRRSSRPRTATTVVTKTKLQAVNSPKKTVTNSLAKVSATRRRRKRKARRNADDYLCLSTSSSDEHIEDWSDEDDLDASPIETDDHFFELDEEETTVDNQPLRPAKTAQTSTATTACNVCSKSDRPESLLLCDGCNDAYHLECLRPVLLSVPDGDWYCPLCEQKQLTDCLIVKLIELDTSWKIVEAKRQIRCSKQSLSRKIKLKDYSSDESITASESDNNDDSMLSTSQINENSNLSSCCFDDEKSNISQRGRHRRTRFDIKKMLDEEEAEKTEFDLQLPKKITRLLHRHERSTTKHDSQFRSVPTRLCDTSRDLNEKLGSPLVYVTGDGNCRQAKSVVTNSKQTLKIVRRWNDVRRRSRLKTISLKLSNETGASDYMDENSGFGPDDISLPYSNDSNSNSGMKDEESAIIRARITLAPPPATASIEKCSTRNLTKKSEANFDRLTRDIQIAVNDAHSVPTAPMNITRINDQQPVKRLQKAKFSPYMSKLPLALPQPPSDASDTFKSNDSSIATDHLANVILTPSSSSSVLDTSDHQPVLHEHP